MPGQHCNGKPSTRENAIAGIGCTLLAIGQFGGLLLLAAGLLRAEGSTITRVTDGPLLTWSMQDCAWRRPALQRENEVSK